MTNNPCQTHQQNQAEAHADSFIQYTVTDHVLLAGQPQPQHWDDLVRCGYKLVINIRSDPERAAIQQRNAEAAGLRYIYLPLPAYELEQEHLESFHKLLVEAGDTPIVIHCRTASRTALLWMLHRMVYDGWTQAQAEAELSNAGYEADSLETFAFCTEDYFDRAGELTPADEVSDSVRG